MDFTFSYYNTIQNKVFSDIGIGGKVNSNFILYVYKLSGDPNFDDGLATRNPYVSNLSAGFSLALGKMPHPLVLDFLIGRSPRNDLKTRFIADWHFIGYSPFSGDKFAWQLFLGAGGAITTHYDTQSNNIDAWDNILAFRIPLGFKIFIVNHFEIFCQFVPQIGWRYSYLKRKDSSGKDKQEFITISDNVSPHFNYLEPGLGLSLGMHYWF